MCGILFYQSNEGVAPQDHLNMNAGLHLLQHRGPDGAGMLARSHFILGHCRLSIIDTQNDALLSNGPFHDEQHDLAVSFNGEITNYRELKIQLQQLGHQFKTNSDIEVLTKAWA